MAPETRPRVPLATMAGVVDRGLRSGRCQRGGRRCRSEASPGAASIAVAHSPEPSGLTPGLAQRLSPAFIVETATGRRNSTASRPRTNGPIRSRQQTESLPSSTLRPSMGRRAVRAGIGGSGGAAVSYAETGHDNSWADVQGSANVAETSLRSAQSESPHHHSFRQRTSPFKSSLLLTCILLSCLPSPGAAFGEYIRIFTFSRRRERRVEKDEPLRKQPTAFHQS